jgi:hypothetical protein
MLMKLEFSQQIFEKFSDKKFYENPFFENLGFPCGRRDGRTNMMELKVAFRGFVKASKRVLWGLRRSLNIASSLMYR